MRITTAGFAALALALVLSGCGPLPRPFAHEPSEPPNALLALPMHAGVVVKPPANVDAEDADAISEALVRALHRVDIVASRRGGNVGSYDLESQIEVERGSRRLVVELIQPDGAVAARHVAAVPPTANWQAIADAAAQPIAAALVGPTRDLAAIEPARGPAAVLPAIAIATVAGAPDADGQVLTRALAFIFQERNIKTVDRAEAGSPQVRGTVKVTTKSPTVRHLAVTWTVHAADGKELGKVEQANDLPLQVLRSAWADIALAVAEGAADGIVNVLEEHGIFR